ncbi:PH domain-containing protein [Parabacteroides sp. OttesenSCG-928-O15]|nr:PH domain-containing protein [Parabacteroides sp. OttesenSCG-928-O15]
MDREFRSKVGGLYHVFLVIVGIGCVASFLQSNIWWIIGMTLITLITIHVFLNTWYVITADGMLIAHCSFFPEKKIAIAEIRTIEPTIMPAWSYALSFDRLLIGTDTGPWMMLSPRNKKEFISVLKSFNSDIEIKKESSFI